MATVIDALIITLGLDASGLKKGSADASKALGDIEAGSKKAGKAADDTAKREAKAAKDKADAERKYQNEQNKRFKEQEEQNKKLAAGLKAVRGELVAMFAVFTGGKGLVDFIVSTITANAAIARQAELFGMSADSLARMQQAAVVAGGTAEGATQTMGNLLSLYTQFQTNPGAVDPYKIFLMNTLGLTPADLRDRATLMGKIVAGMPRLRARFGNDEGVLGTQLYQLGIVDPGLERLLIEGKLQAALKGVTGLSADAAAKAEKDATDWANLLVQWRKVATQLTTDLMPTIQQFIGWLDQVTTWAQQHPNDVKNIFIGIGTAITALGVIIAAFSLAAAPELAVAAAAAFAIGAGVSYAGDRAKDAKGKFDWTDPVNRTTTSFENLQKVLGGLFDPATLQWMGQAIENFLLKPFKTLVDQSDIVVEAMKAVEDLASGNTAAAQLDIAKAAGDLARVAATGAGAPDAISPTAANAAVVAAAANSKNAGPFGDLLWKFFGGHEGGKAVMDANGYISKWGLNQKAWPKVDVSSLSEAQAKALWLNWMLPMIAKRKLRPAMALLFADTYSIGPEMGEAAMKASGGTDINKFMQARYAYMMSLLGLPSGKYEKYRHAWTTRNADVLASARALDAASAAQATAGVRTGAAAAANNSNTTNWRSTTANFNGPISVNAPGGNPDLIASRLHGALQQQFALATQAATGLI